MSKLIPCVLCKSLVVVDWQPDENGEYHAFCDIHRIPVGKK